MQFILAVVVALVAAQAGLAQQAEPQNKGTKPNYRELVKGLASPNKPIKIEDHDGEETLSIPPHYDQKAQQRIEINRAVLDQHCEKALPFLIEGCADARYSLTTEFEGTHDNWSVGEICEHIIADHVELFRQYMRFDGAGHWDQYNFVPRLDTDNGMVVTDKRRREIEEWWRKHKNKSLHDLQLEAFDWAIANDATK